jgi:hypothetical protein
MVKSSYKIKNACKRREVHARAKAEKKKAKKADRAKRQREAEELGEEAPPKQVGGGMVLGICDLLSCQIVGYGAGLAD